MTARDDAMPEIGDREIAEWLLSTLRLFQVNEADAHRITALFLNALKEQS